MSLFAGIWNLSDTAETLSAPATSKRELLQVWTRGPDSAQTFDQGRLFLTSVDVGAFASPGVRNTDEATTVVAGEPLFEASASDPRMRSCDLSRLAPRLSADAATALRKCRGTFAICHYDRHADTLVLAADRVGVRPLYYYVSLTHVYFSTSLRVLEALTAVPKRLDLRGLTEETVLGFALADRTPYADIRVLQSGEFLRCSGRHVNTSTYFRFDDTEQTELSPDEFLDAAYDCFRTAVAIRGARDNTARSFLSGGLDSRCIAVTLKDLGKDLATVTFEIATNPDRQIADEFAKVIGSRHAVERGQPGLAPHELLKYRLRERSWLTEQSNGYPQLVFSGDGGSVGVGYVYMNDRIVQLLRSGRTAEAVRTYLGNHRLPRKIFKPDAYKELADAVFDGVMAELEDIRTSDPAKAFYFFLMKNDQRRHLYKFVYEDIDIRGVEYLMPFYDGQFIELLASAPADWFIGHAFYHQWLTRFPPAAMQIPWQTYPGHLTCPVEGFKVERTQWDSTTEDRVAATTARLAQCREALRNPVFPAALMRRPAVWLAYLSQRFGRRDCSAAIDTFIKFHTYFNRCKGKFINPQSMFSARKIDS